MIQVKNLRFAYGRTEIIRDISLEASKGEMLCVLGPNGTGKSTLFKCMLGLLSDWSGEITIDDESVRDMTPSQKARKMAYIPQATNPAFAYSVIDMVTMGVTAQLRSLRVPGTKERKQAEEALKRLGIQELAERDYTRLSGGEQQLVLIARALCQGSEILIMDEPTSSLDYGNQMRVEMQLRQLVREGYAIIQSMHNPEQAFLFADRVICIRDGYVLADGKPKDVLDEKMIQELYRIPVRHMDTADGKGRFFEVIDQHED